MKSYVKYLFAFALLAGALGFYLLQPKGDINITQEKAALDISASQLYQDFESNESTANEKYAGKVMAVTGLLKTVSRQDNGKYQLSLDAASSMGEVTINLDVVEETLFEQLQIGQEVKVKGVCTGYLFDVVLDHCMLLPTGTHSS